MTTSRRASTLSALIGASALVLTACSQSPDAQPEAAPSPTTVTVTAKPTTTTVTPRDDSTATDAGAAGEDTVGGEGGNVDPATGNCSTDGAAAIADGASRIAPPLSYDTSVPWVFGGKTNYNTCDDLSFATLMTQGATGSSPYQLLLFHRGKFLGTGTKCNLGFQQVTDASTRSVDVDYRYLNPGDITANPTGHYSLTFVWTGSGVQMNGSIPAAASRGQC